MLSNNHVGNEWYSYITYNNKEFKNGSTITAKMNSTININTTIVEDDKIPDSSTSYVTLTLKDNYEKKKNCNVGYDSSFCVDCVWK